MTDTHKIAVFCAAVVACATAFAELMGR